MRVQSFLLCGALLFALLSGAGCAHYEYEIVSPPNLRQRIGTDRDAVMKLGVLEYRMRSVDNHLVVRIFNTSGEVIHFQGDRSTVVDPSGQSHPMRGQSIAPGSYMKLILPPMMRYAAVYPAGPSVSWSWGWGWGWGYGGPGWGPPYWYDPFWAPPVYVPVHEAGVSYWRWEGPGDARLILVFQQGQDPPFTQEWAFGRVKA